MLILRKYELQNLRDQNNTCLDADFRTPEVQNLRARNNTCEKYELQILISSLDAFNRITLKVVGYPRDAPATVLFGEWFRFGKPSDQQFLFERTVSA
ncbi:hypothetical protein LXL04_008992 [Taraxacum kok-saghyz]